MYCRTFPARFFIDSISSRYFCRSGFSAAEAVLTPKTISSAPSSRLDDSGRVIADLADRQREGGFLIADYYPDEVRLESKYGCHRCAREIYLARRNPAAYRELIDPATRPRLEQVMRHADGSPLTPEEIKSHFPYYQAGSENRL